MHRMHEHGSGGTKRAIRTSKGVHLVLPALPVSDALVLQGKRRGQVVFLVPWYGRTLVGTTDTEFDGDPGRVEVGADDTRYLLAQAQPPRERGEPPRGSRSRSRSRHQRQIADG